MTTIDCPMQHHDPEPWQAWEAAPSIVGLCRFDLGAPESHHPNSTHELIAGGEVFHPSPRQQLALSELPIGDTQLSTRTYPQGDSCAAPDITPQTGSDPHERAELARLEELRRWPRTTAGGRLPLVTWQELRALWLEDRARRGLVR